MTGEIKACPFCGGMADWAGKETTGYRVVCVCCDARGTWGDYGYQALTAWNTRPIEDELAASRDRASDACASVQRERDALREMVGEAVEVLRQSSHALSASYQEAQCEWTNRDKAGARHSETVRNFRNAASAFLSRYEGEVK